MYFSIHNIYVCTFIYTFKVPFFFEDFTLEDLDRFIELLFPVCESKKLGPKQRARYETYHARLTASTIFHILHTLFIISSFVCMGTVNSPSLLGHRHGCSHRKVASVSSSKLPQFPRKPVKMTLFHDQTSTDETPGLARRDHGEENGRNDRVPLMTSSISTLLDGLSKKELAQFFSDLDELAPTVRRCLQFLGVVALGTSSQLSTIHSYSSNGLRSCVIMCFCEPDAACRAIITTIIPAFHIDPRRAHQPLSEDQRRDKCRQAYHATYFTCSAKIHFSDRD